MFLQWRTTGSYLCTLWWNLSKKGAQLWFQRSRYSKFKTRQKCEHSLEQQVKIPHHLSTFRKALLKRLNFLYLHCTEKVKF